MDLDISDFIIKVFYFFHNQHLRCKNFEKIQTDLKLPKHTFIKHISTRWLTIGPAAERVIEQLPALNEYFLKYIPRKEIATIKKQSYLDIIKYLKDTFLRPTLEFILYIHLKFLRVNILVKCKMMNRSSISYIFSIEKVNLYTLLEHCKTLHIN